MQHSHICPISFRPHPQTTKISHFILLVSFIAIYKYNNLQIVNLSKSNNLKFYLAVTNIISNFVTQKPIINPNKKN